MNTLKRHPTQEESRTAYKNVIWFYDLWSRMTEQKAMELGIRWAEVKDGERIADMGCGTGRLLEQMIDRNPHGFNTGIDLSPDMLRKADKRLSERPGRYELLQGDLLEFDFKPDSYDLIFSFYVVDMMPEEAFSQIADKYYHMLHSGGRLVMGSFSMGNRPIHRFWYYLAKYFPKLMTYCRPVDFSPFLKEAGFSIEKHNQVNQNSFPSEVILAKKPVK